MGLLRKWTCFSKIGGLRLLVDASGITLWLMDDQDMSVSLHCVCVNFAPMSTFLWAAVMNKVICLRSDNSICVPWMVILSTSHVLMNLDFGNMSDTKLNIRLHFVFLQSQWSCFCSLWQPRQHPIPPAMAAIHKVSAKTRAMQLNMWDWITLNNLRRQQNAIAPHCSHHFSLRYDDYVCSAAHASAW